MKSALCQRVMIEGILKLLGIQPSIQYS